MGGDPNHLEVLTGLILQVEVLFFRIFGPKYPSTRQQPGVILRTLPPSIGGFNDPWG